ncbi:MAG TPA: DUF790 family protein [Polyangiaceae bacterium]|nr:DUF790 family protein [Polyangiaceae bacterium]
MLPHNLLAYSVRDDIVVPRYLTARDEVWVRVLTDELDALVGRKMVDVDRVLKQRLPRLAAQHGVPRPAVEAVRHVLLKEWRTEIRAAVPPIEIRRTVFELAGQSQASHDEVLADAAAKLGIRVEQVVEGLFADRASERRLVGPSHELAPSRVLELYNLALVQGLLLRSEHVVARVTTHVRSVVRFAKLKGLLCLYAIDERGTKITLSGPLALFRQTFKYGLALATFFPAVVVTPDWSVEALCWLGHRHLTFRANASDPIAATHVLPRDTDSALEKRLLREFRRLDAGWELRRETIAVQVGSGSFFPDFTLERGADRVYIEIIGFYTPEYLASKLEALRKARLTNVVVCIDESLSCADDDIVADEIIRFRKRVEPAALLAAAERCVGRSASSHDRPPKGR